MLFTSMAMTKSCSPVHLPLPSLRTYNTLAWRRQPLVDWFVNGLEKAGCRVVMRPDAKEAPFVFVFEAPITREQIGVVAYLFTSTSRTVKHRPEDEARFQLKYGSKDDEYHGLFLDETGQWITMLAGIDVEHGVIVSCDPIIHQPTLMFISIEYKDQEVETSRGGGWHTWQREKTLANRRDRRKPSDPVEVLVGCTQDRLLDLVLFERAARGLSPGHRMLLAEQWAERPISPAMIAAHDALGDRLAALKLDVNEMPTVSPVEHELLHRLGISHKQLLEIIQRAPRLEMAVRGWVAQHHLHGVLESTPGVLAVQPIEMDGQPDFRLTLAPGIGSRRRVLLECKNVLRRRTAAGEVKLDFQRTRASKGDPCSRYYRPEEFDVVAACLHPVTEQWDFLFRRTDHMAQHPVCVGRLHHNVLIVNPPWIQDLAMLLATL